jgi:hypothetical protein
MFIPDPDFSQYWIPDLTTIKGGGGEFVVFPFFEPKNLIKLGENLYV